MTWNPERYYNVRIGGIFYRNVQLPIVYDGSPMVTINRSTETGELGLCFTIFNGKGEPIGSVENNEITISNSEEYAVMTGFKRQAVVDKTSGRVLCDLKFATRQSDPEIEASMILFSKDRFPIILHPDRTKFGKANDNSPPNISRLTLTTTENSEAGGISLGWGNAIYLLGIAFENFKNGISVDKRGNE
ncbi:MAG: hypothetical protein PHI97_30645 [Desulfobulbus sp.]|nr:hypothetical protein [Desulfobulbus sp.]